MFFPPGPIHFPMNPDVQPIPFDPSMLPSEQVLAAILTVFVVAVLFYIGCWWAIIDKAGEFYRKWNPRNGTDVNDAILAATVLQTGGKIYTLNSKHYPMPEVTVQRAWKA